MHPSDEDYLRNFPDRAIRQLLEHPDNLRELCTAVAPNVVGGFKFPQAQPVPRDFVLEDWRQRQSDVLFLVPYESPAGAQSALVCVLIEHQSAPDPRMPLRVPLYAMLYWDGEWKSWEQEHPAGEPLRLRPILPIVFHTGSAPWRTNRQLEDLIDGPEELRQFAPKWPILFWDLAERSIEELLASAGEWLKALAVVRAEREATERFLAVFRQVLEDLEALGRRDEIRWHDLMRFVLAWAFRRRPKAERVQLLETAKSTYKDRQRRREVENMGKTLEAYEQAVLAEGRAEGREEGKSLGVLVARREDLQELLTERFGELPPEIVQKIEATNDPARLKAALRRGVHIDSLDELQL